MCKSNISHSNILKIKTPKSSFVFQLPGSIATIAKEKGIEIPLADAFWSENNIKTLVGIIIVVPLIVFFRKYWYKN